MHRHTLSRRPIAPLQLEKTKAGGDVSDSAELEQLKKDIAAEAEAAQDLLVVRVRMSSCRAA